MRRPAASELTFLRLSFAVLIIGVFWMTVQLYQYTIWLRGADKALLLVGIIISTAAIYSENRMRSNIDYRNRYILEVYCILTLTLITLFVIYLTVSEPSPVSLLVGEVPGARALKLEGIAIILLILAPLGAALARVRIETISRHLPICIVTFGIVALLARSMSFVYYACGADFPHTLLTCHGFGLSDIGGTTLNAVHAAQKGINPYTTDVNGDYTRDLCRGYRYWPMMFAAYMPLVSLFNTGVRAIPLTNFVLDVIAAALIFVLVRYRSGWLCGVLAASLYLILPMLPGRLYGMADTDLVPTVLLLGAFALYQARLGLAGMMVGLSVSAKFVPGVVMAICCFPKLRRSRYLGGFVIGLIPAVMFCLLAPSEFIYNTVWCGVAADTIDSSSWLYGAPVYIIRATQLAFILFLAAVSFVVILRAPDFFERCALYVICVVGILLVSRAHNNYMTWWIPFFCILLSRPLSRILCLPGSEGNVAEGDARPLSRSQTTVRA